MATTIKSSALDFGNIKNNLKSHLEEKSEFKDYDFEASGLSNILDVLAYNTHLNALTANFALNESFLGTAQLRSSLVSLAEGLGYVPDSKTAATGDIKMSLNLSGLSDVPSTISLASGYTFTTTVDEINYTFQTQETIVASDDDNGFYQFTTLGGDAAIPVYEGKHKRKTFIAGDAAENITYIIPDMNIDIDTAVVRVYESSTSSSFSTFTNILKATVINESSTLYILKEMPNGQYELTFGNGTTLGKTPTGGNKITVDFLSVSGATSNGAKIFEPNNRIEVTEPSVGLGETRFPTITTVLKSSGGSDKESLESIRKNAPFQYAAQNRMVTYADYSSLVLRNFSSYIKDIQAWGGEDNINPEFGTVFLALLYNNGISESRKSSLQQEIIDLAGQLSVASFDMKFSDTIKTFIELQVYFQFNDALTTLSLNTVQDKVKTVVGKYFNEHTGTFGQSFRRSNLLSLIDDVSPAILSSRTNVKMQQRFTPITGLESDHSFSFPVPIAVPDDVNLIITSSTFLKNNLSCQIKNKLSTNILQVVSLSDNKVIIDNVGYYDAGIGSVSIVGLLIDAFIGSSNEVKLAVMPANQSAITPEREYVLDYDTSRTKANGILVTATN